MIGALAQEFSGFIGGMETPDVAGSTHAWQTESCREFLSAAACSLSWIHEGHVDNHHRDGSIGQAWVNLSLPPRQ